MYILFLLCIPAIEIWLFIIIGESIGILATLLSCLVTAGIGITLVRIQGILTLKDLSLQPQGVQSNLKGTLVQGGLLLISGISLLIPGFFSDTIGFLLLIPPLRRKLSVYIATRFNIPSQTPHNHESDPIIIEGDYTVHSEDTEASSEKNPWLSNNNH